MMLLRLRLLGLLLVLVACTSTAPPSPSPSPVRVTEQALPLPSPTPLPPTPTALPEPTSTPAIAWTETDTLWAGRSIYFLMTDRFSNGDSSNDAADGFASDRSDPRRWHGGDLRGVLQQLDYIKGMGFSAIWITPVTQQRSPNGFHGYWQYDPYQIDPHFGSLDDLRALVEAAHQREMLVMLDVVPNHTGDFRPASTAAPPFDDPSWYHDAGNIQNYGNQQEVENGDLLGLDDLDQNNLATRTELLAWIAWLRSETGIDGLRVDTARHMPKDFLTEFDAAADIHTMGEVFSGDIEYVGAYSHALDAVADFPFYHASKNAFLGGQSLVNLPRAFERDTEYRNPHTNGLFIDNHDVERFMCLATGGPDDDKQRQLHQALAVMFTVRGIPIVYYGTEQQFAGCKDPNNREDLFESFDPTSPTYAWLTQLNAVRQAHPALQLGSQTDLVVEFDHWAFQRTANDDTVIVCVNNAWKPQTITVSGLSDLDDGTQLRDALGSTTTTVQQNTVQCTLEPKQVVVLVVQ